MNFKATVEGVYDATNFTARDLPSIVKMVKLNEEMIDAEREKNAAKIEEAEKQVVTTV